MRGPKMDRPAGTVQQRTRRRVQKHRMGLALAGKPERDEVAAAVLAYILSMNAPSLKGLTRDGAIGILTGWGYNADQCRLKWAAMEGAARAQALAVS